MQIQVSTVCVWGGAGAYPQRIPGHTCTVLCTIGKHQGAFATVRTGGTCPPSGLLINRIGPNMLNEKITVATSENFPFHYFSTVAATITTVLNKQNTTSFDVHPRVISAMQLIAESSACLKDLASMVLELPSFLDLL